MNTIGKITFDFKMENEEFTRSLYGRWDNFFPRNVEKIVDSILQKYNKDDSIIEIDNLQLDLGRIEEDLFDEYFPILLRQKLEDALLQYLNHSASKHPDHLSEKDYLFNILCRYLLHGALSWSIASEYKNIGNLFLNVLQHNGKKLKAFLLTYGHYTSLQQRLVYQFDDPLLEKGIFLLAPRESVFICSYIHFLKEKYDKIDKVSVRKSDYRNAVWLVVYAYILTDRSSYFNKKSFVLSTVNRLAVSYNITYEYFLNLLTVQLESLLKTQSVDSELYQILKQLKGELSDRLLKESVNDYQKIYSLITSKAEGGQKETFSNDELKLLRLILSNESTCRRFLQPLKESQIIFLVKSILPNESPFVIDYARTLDAQQQNGFLEGKAGGEFLLLKWQIILPVIFENKGTALNRKYFVLATIKRIAAHYNLRLNEVLKYICSFSVQNMKAGLFSIFSELLSECAKRVSGDISLVSDKLSVDEIKNLIKTGSAIDIRNIDFLIDTLSDDYSQTRLVKSLSEEEHLKLISLLVPSESYFILPYAAILDMQQNNAVIKSIAQKDFRNIKWTFIYSILFASKNQVFNHKYFVEKSLSKIAAHYNVNIRDLLIYFYQEKVLENINLPFDLIKIFEELKHDYGAFPTNKKKILQKGNRNEEKESIKILEKYFGKNPSYAKIIAALAKHHTFVCLLDYILLTESALQNYLRVELNVNVDRKKILELLLDLSAEYRFLNRRDIMYYIIEEIMRQLEESKQLQLIGRLEELSKTNSLLENIIDFITPKKEIIMDNQNLNERHEDTVYTVNTGAVLLAPFLPRFFSMLDITDKNNFKGEAERLKAIAALHYVLTGKENVQDEQYIMHKLLIGMDISKPIPQLPELTEGEKGTCESLLKGVLSNWQKLKNTSIVALREAFLMRPGKVEVKDDFIHITVEEKAYDMLLDSIPWNFRMIKFPWMEKRIEVKWR